MDELIDAIRRIVSRWVNTTSPLLADASPGDTILNVETTRRFKPGDEVMLHDPLEYETGLIVDSIIDETHISLTSPVMYSWPTSSSSVLQKTINEMIVEAIYKGDPEVIEFYPSVTVNGTTGKSDWMTLDSTKERFDIEIGVYVLASSQEDGYQFVLKTAKAIMDGLKHNIYPLVNDYATAALAADALVGDVFIKVEDTSVFEENSRLFVENHWYMEETRILAIIDATTLQVSPPLCRDYRVADAAIAIWPRRFIFNSWPSTVEYGKIKKGDLMQAAVIHWFGEEEEVQNMRLQDPHLQ